VLHTGTTLYWVEAHPATLSAHDKVTREDPVIHVAPSGEIFVVGAVASCLEFVLALRALMLFTLSLLLTK
jgi:hypothetical protein